MVKIERSTAKHRCFW